MIRANRDLLASAALDKAIFTFEAALAESEVSCPPRSGTATINCGVPLIELLHIGLLPVSPAQSSKGPTAKNGSDSFKTSALPCR